MAKFRSPLSPELIECLADIVDSGNPVSADLSPYDAATILGVVIRRRERRRVAALFVQAELAGDAAIRDRLVAREEERRLWQGRGLPELAPPDDIVVELMTSVEGMLLINLLAAMVCLPMSLATGQSVMVGVVPASPFWMAVPLGAVTGYATRREAQARYLAQYLTQKTSGDPQGDHGVIVKRSTPAAECHPHGHRLRPALRAWANSMTPAAMEWGDRVRVLRHFDAIETAGLRIMAMYGRAMDRLRLPLDGLYPERPFGLPLHAAPLLPKEVHAVGLEPELTPESQPGPRWCKS